MLSLPLSAFAGKTVYGGYYCDHVDYVTCFPDEAPGNPAQSVILASSKGAKTPAEPAEGLRTSGALVVASLILLFLRTRTL
jgi:hypothetical protein